MSFSSSRSARDCAFRKTQMTAACSVLLSLSLLCGVLPRALAQNRPAPAPSQPVNAPLASGRLAPLTPGHIAIAGDLLIGLDESADEGAFLRQIQHIGQSVGRSAALHAYHVRLNAGVSDAAALQWLRMQHGVAYAENNHRIQIASTPSDVSFAAQYALPKVQADLAWPNWKPQGQVIVAIVDTGVDYTHNDLANVTLQDTAGNPIGYDATGSGTFLDGYGHGTHVAGIAAAQINNGASYAINGTNYGTAGAVGWNGKASVSDTSHVKIMPVRVLDSTGSGTDDQVASGIIWAADHGARVISMSLGEPDDDPNNPAVPITLNAAVQYAWGKGVVIVAAAGNSSTNANFYPAACPNVVSVAATDNNDTLANFSNFGSWVLTAAPGVNILSTFPTYDPGTHWGLYYGYLSGTSMATPHVAAEAALLIAQKLSLTNQQVHDAIIAPANVDPVATGGRYLDNGAGGRVNFFRALNSVSPSGPAAFSGLYSTGLDNSGNPLTDGASDLHYSIVSAPSGSGGTPFVTLQKFPISSGLWLPDTSASKWISPHADEGANYEAPGDYTYQTTFTLTGDPSTAQISGRLAVDSVLKAIILNGVTIANPPTASINYWSSFTIGSGFVSGTNTLKFVINRTGSTSNPSGFRCELSGASSSAPATSVPAAPAGLTATAGNNQITLNWTAPTGATSYNIKRGASLSGPFTTVATLVTGTSYADSGTYQDGTPQTPNGSTFYYVVTAMNTVGESAASNVAGATPRATGRGSISGLYNTGIGSSGSPLADGASDPHYALASTPSGTGGAPFVTLEKFPVGGGVWMDDTATSKWISPSADESAYLDPAGSYTYQTTFTVAGDATAVQISCLVAGDDQVSAIVLNGKTVATNVGSGFQAWGRFTITSGFVTGTNTLQFIVANAGTSSNPTGFRCELTGTSGGGVPTQGSISGLFNTGLDSAGNPAADASGEAHYSLASTPSGSGGTPYVTMQKFPIVNGAWMLDTSTSKWISPTPDESAYLDAAGSYTYQTTFTVTGDLTTVSITGRLAGDDSVTAIILNGQTVATNVAGGFQSWYAFNIASGFKTGTNTLQFVVVNAGTSSNPSGFRCEMTGTSGGATAAGALTRKAAGSIARRK